MSILKSIMHHWNKTTNSYDILHPETESSQITDWHSGIMASLASKTLGTVVDAITTDSVLGKLIKMLLNASGVKYLIDTNGYICFGEYFGGLIIQWGITSTRVDSINGVMNWKYPLAMREIITLLTNEAYPEIWLSYNNATVSAVANNSFGGIESHIVTMSIMGGSVVPTYASTRCLVIGKI